MFSSSIKMALMGQNDVHTHTTQTNQYNDKNGNNEGMQIHVVVEIVFSIFF